MALPKIIENIDARVKKSGDKANLFSFSFFYLFWS